MSSTERLGYEAETNSVDGSDDKKEKVEEAIRQIWKMLIWANKLHHYSDIFGIISRSEENKLIWLGDESSSIFNPILPHFYSGNLMNQI